MAEDNSLALALQEFDKAPEWEGCERATEATRAWVGRFTSLAAQQNCIIAMKPHFQQLDGELSRDPEKYAHSKFFFDAVVRALIERQAYRKYGTKDVDRENGEGHEWTMVDEFAHAAKKIFDSHDILETKDLRMLYWTISTLKALRSKRQSHPGGDIFRPPGTTPRWTQPIETPTGDDAKFASQFNQEIHIPYEYPSSGDAIAPKPITIIWCNSEEVKTARKLKQVELFGKQQMPLSLLERHNFTQLFDQIRSLFNLNRFSQQLDEMAFRYQEFGEWCTEPISPETMRDVWKAVDKLDFHLRFTTSTVPEGTRCRQGDDPLELSEERNLTYTLNDSNGESRDYATEPMADGRLAKLDEGLEQNKRHSYDMNYQSNNLDRQLVYEPLGQVLPDQANHLRFRHSTDPEKRATAVQHIGVILSNCFKRGDIYSIPTARRAQAVRAEAELLMQEGAEFERAKLISQRLESGASISDANQDDLDPGGEPVKATASEVRTFKQHLDLMNAEDYKGPPLREAWANQMPNLELNSKKTLPRHPLQSPSDKNPVRPHQVIGIEAICRAEREVGMVLVGDAVGTGKTKTTTGALARRIQDDLEAGTFNGPTLVLCPANLVSDWLAEAANWPVIKPVLFYGNKSDKHDTLFRVEADALAEGTSSYFEDDRWNTLRSATREATQTVFYTSYPTWTARVMQVPEKGGLDPASKFAQAQDHEMDFAINPSNMQLPARFRNFFYRVVCDEAHFLRSGSESVQFQSVKLLRAPRAILVSGTPMLTGAVSLKGLLEILWSEDAIEEGLGKHLTKEEKKEMDDEDWLPINLEGRNDKRIAYIWSPRYFDRALRIARHGRTDLLHQTLRHIFRQILLRRQLTDVITWSDGHKQKIGEMEEGGLKNVELDTTELMMTEGEQEEYDAYHHALAKKLFFKPTSSTKPDQKQTAMMNMGTLRRLMICCSSLRLMRLDKALRGHTKVDDIETWNDPSQVAKHGMNWLAATTQFKNDPLEVPQWQKPEDLPLYFQSLMIGSPKERYFSSIVHRHVLEGREQMLVFFRTPLVLWKVQKTFELMGFRIACITGETASNKRQEIKKAFDAGGVYDMLFTLYNVGSYGISYHANCRRVVLFEPGQSANEELQAWGRVFRLGQKRAVFVHRLCVLGTFNEHQEAKLIEQSKETVFAFAGTELDNILELARQFTDQHGEAEASGPIEEYMQGQLEEFAMVLSGMTGQWRNPKLTQQKYKTVKA